MSKQGRLGLQSKASPFPTRTQAQDLRTHGPIGRVLRADRDRDASLILNATGPVVALWLPSLTDPSRPLIDPVTFLLYPVATLIGVRLRKILTLKRTGTTKSEVKSTLAS
ncbi:hypothetical protein Taro_012986 [Colocasia esculenta]|uniref:Uncharacterized protein n=1 Tax=Colocasia esculenta TaxID=4460 RepID=A0A843UAC9_COLES|nr:hypothetical protein [Colocasia esculenta]